VASRLEGIEDAVKDGRNGILVDPNDPRGFADTITGLLVNKEEATKFGAGARRFSLDTYGWERVAESYVEEFARLALR
jgi:glycosyltransferase involved in cell wall biosynthesis